MDERIGAGMIKVEAVVIRERVETVIDAVEEQTGHVGVTVVEAIGHGRQRGITHEYRGRTFESRFLPKAVLTFVVAEEIANGVVAAIADAARSGNESGDGIVWTTPVGDVTHNRTGLTLEEVEYHGGTHGSPVSPLLKEERRRRKNS
jgi:nitrogen regulatory protein P-II 1